MPIKVTCNACGGELNAPDDAAGKRGRCPVCGNILPIPADAPRVPAVEPSPVPAPPQRPPTADPPLAPRPPVLGMEQPRPAPLGPPLGNRPATESRPPSDPFARTAVPPPLAANGPSTRWQRVARGLGTVRWGVFFLFLGVLAPTIIAILERNGLAIPQQEPGLLGVPGAALTGEIKVGSALVFLLLGGLLIVLGRMSVAGVPRDSGARGPAAAAAYASLLAFAGFILVVLFGVFATLEGTPPIIVPLADVTGPNIRFQERIERYSQHFFMDGENPPGQIQRFGAVLFLISALVGELWFLGALARMAVHLRSARAIGRLNRHSILVGLLLILLAAGIAAFNLYGEILMQKTIQPQWNQLNDGVKVAVRAGAFALVVLIAAFLYLRSLAGVRHAIHEAHPA